ncbi:MAG: band-7 C-terminal domain-containing protein [Candidatus Nitrotoga sp.]
MAVATATALAVQQVALAIQYPGGMEAVNLKVAEKFVEAFGNVAKQDNTMIMLGNMADMGVMVAVAMSIVKTHK